MDSTRWTDRKGRSFRNKPGWSKSDSGSLDKLERFLAGGEKTRFGRKHPLPSVGDRFGELTVERVELGSHGGLRGIWAKCSCGAGPYEVHSSNLFNGKSTRCETCAKAASAKTRVEKRYAKSFFCHSAALPDTEHRRRLLNRLAAAVTRCHSPNAKQYHDYGGRGIFVCEAWRGDKSAFLLHVVTLKGWDDSSLEMDREDNNRGYEPGNIRFVTKQKNNSNRRTIQEMQSRINELESRLRHCKCGAAQQIHDTDK